MAVDLNILIGVLAELEMVDAGVDFSYKRNLRACHAIGVDGEGDGAHVGNAQEFAELKTSGGQGAFEVKLREVGGCVCTSIGA